jgi:nucleoside-triphosphatase THEP1
MNSLTFSSAGAFAASAAKHEAGDALPLGVMVYDNSLEGDALLTQAADGLAAEGYRLGGVVQSSVHRPGRRKCDMYLRDLMSGEEILISLDRGNEARGCRLDADAFARVGLWGERALAAGVDLLVINKFGKEEAQGRGLRPLIAEALIAGIPVMLGVSSLNLDDLLAFAGAAAVRLPPGCEAIMAWCRAAARRRAE